MNPRLCPIARASSRRAIESLIYEADEETVVIGFEMELANAGHYKRPITVMLQDATIFDGSGNLIANEDLAVEDVVNVRGKLNLEGAWMHPW